MLFHIQFYDDIQDKYVADLGTGCGMLGIAACVLECGQCVGFDIDEGALAICRSNLEDQEIENMELVQCDVTKLELATKWNEKFDTVIMNPPFGTKKNDGLDLLFLRQAIAMVTQTGVVYSLHKTSTRNHLVSVVRDSWQLDIEVIAELHFQLPKTYKCHHKDSLDVDVDLIRVTKQKKQKKKVDLIQQVTKQKKKTITKKKSSKQHLMSKQ